MSSITKPVLFIVSYRVLTLTDKIFNSPGGRLSV